MMKLNFIFGCAGLYFLFFLSPFVEGQITKTLSYDKNGIEFKSLKKGDGIYERVTLKESFPSSEVGKPDLPVFYYRFYVPQGKK